MHYYDLIIGYWKLMCFSYHFLFQGPNGALTYSIIGEQRSELFSIDALGDVTLNASLDKESDERHKILILVRDGGTPPLTAIATVTLQVQDVNDNAPTLLQTEHISVQS